jgi:hypothetical protein
MNNKEKYEGSIHNTNSCGKLRILNYNDVTSVDIVFLDTGYKTNVWLKSILEGSVKDKYKPTVEGVGYIGETSTRENGKPKREYIIWRNLLRRCYNINQHVKQPTYAGCAVAEEFKSLEFFSIWCKKQKGFENTDWVLDKDLLLKGNKVYSPETCVFVPEETNGALIKNDKCRGYLPIGVKPRRAGTYQVAVSMGGYMEYVGIFKTPEEAFIGYKKIKRVLFKRVGNLLEG